MINIDYIFELINSDDIETQNKGIALAQDVKNLDVFMQPGDYRTDSWDNCAKIICDRSDKELFPYLNKLFSWINDLNKPGAYRVFERIEEFEPTNEFMEAYRQEIHYVKRTHDQMWLDVLYNLPFIDLIDKEIAILKMLSSDNEPKDQEKGIILAFRYCSLGNLFPADDDFHCVDYWENFSRVIDKKEDASLTDYLEKMLQWTKDMTAPGAKRIFNRLMRYKDKEILQELIERQRSDLISAINDSENWERTLEKLKNV